MSARADELALARRSAERFARDALAPRAAELERDPHVCAAALDEAAALGLVAFGDGAETGVFACCEGGPDAALGAALLEALAATSAGFAFDVLVQGLGSWAAAALGEGPLAGPVAMVLPGGSLGWCGGLADRAFVVGADSEGAAAGAASCIGACAVAGGPTSVLGLRAAHPWRASGPWRADAALDAPLAATTAAGERIACLASLGGTAIAAGLARGAVDEATRYAHERFQGGALIAELPVVREMLARAAHQQRAIALLCAALTDPLAGACAGDAAAAARSGFRAVAELCIESVTTALQVLGGYGYMADFGLERRFRDAHALSLAIGGARPAAWRGARP